MASLSNVCMNGSCGSTSSIQWRKGWGLRSGGSAILCDNCGSVYGQLIFCDTFHLKETGWRACSSCGKRLHCGCIASKSFLELLDDGSVECINCVKRAELSSIQIPRDEEPNGCSMSAKEHIDEMQSISFCTKTDVVDKKKLMFLGTSMEGEGQNSPLQSQKDETNGSTAQTNREQVVPPVREVRGSRVSSLTQIPIGSFVIGKQEDGKQTRGIKRMYESLAQTSLSKTICAPSGSLNLALHTPGVPAEAKEHQLASSFQQGQKSRHLLPKPIKIGHETGPEGSKDVFPQLRVARPPVEGRGRNQLLPRYWPRITDQELQQISGDSNSTIVPLFEKVLSASDAGRIGRLVLPKACAEAFFPPISQPEGLPLRIQDVKGKEWMFQFRFWPNNNSRMYVLEGVTPCIQSMQLQAGDTVTFSRMDPEGKLVMGCRKALNQQNTQETQISATLNGTPTNGTFVSGTIENLPVVSGYSSHLQSMKGTSPHLNALPEPLNSTNGGISWRRAEDHGGWPSEGLSMQSLLVSENKRSRNIGSKSRRLIMDSEDVLTLRLTWEEAQDLLRPPPTVKPTIVMIEGYEFEEYEEPPVFGKKTIFTTQPFGGQDQWAQCDSCSRWRKLPAEVLLPPMWTCADNAWDPERCSCSAPDEMSSKDLENFLRMNMDIKQRRVTTSNKLTQERETSALDALATVAVLGDNRGDSGTPSVATTTRHPRHRPGCTCIVCIQPPSGQGPKHIPTCTCNVCMTVKRRFETLMMRKKKRKELELEIAQRNPPILFPKDEVEQDGASRHTALLPPDHSEFEARPPSNEPESCTLNKITSDTSKGQIDLNCDPDRDDDLQAGLTPATMTSLLQVASRPLETYLQRNGLASLASENQPSSSSNVLQQVTENCEGQPPDEAPTDVAQVRENGSYDEENSVHDETEEDTV